MAPRSDVVGVVMGSIQKSQLPGGALLRRYSENGHYTDCYSVETGRPVTHAQYVTAFYTTLLFKVERIILKWAVSKPSTDAEASALANSKRETFAAWRVEARDHNQLLLCDYQGRTRSWLMIEAVSNEETRLYFGSAVVRTGGGGDQTANPKRGFGLLMRFHKAYSVALLYCAKRRLERAA